MAYLQKEVPSRTERFKVKQYKRGFLEYSVTFETARSGSRDKMNRCYWCKERFSYGDQITLAIPEGRGGNRVLCSKCTDELDKSTM